MTRIPIKLPNRYILGLDGYITQRKSIVVTEPLTSWEEFYESLHKLTQYAAKNIYYKFQQICQARVIEVDDLYQEAQLVLYDCWKKYNCLEFEDLSAMTKAAIWRRLRDIMSRKSYDMCTIDELCEKGEEPGYELDLDSDIDMSYKLIEVRKLLAQKPIALRILDEWLAPSEITLNAMHEDMKIRAEQVKNGELPANFAPKSLRLTKNVLLHSFKSQGYTKVAFDENYRVLRQSIREVFY